MLLIPISKPFLPSLHDYNMILRKLWKSKMLSNFGPMVRDLESVIRTKTGVSHCYMVSSADVGLVVAIGALDLTKGGEVICPSFTFNSTANSILWNGLVPRFVDIDRETFNIDPELVEDAINDSTVAIMGVHTFGSPCNMTGLSEIARRNNIPLITDSAQAYGATYKGKHVGTLGDVSVYSFSPTKVVTSGEGGAVTTKKAIIGNRVSYIRAYGFSRDYITKYLGINGKMSEFHAALGLLTLPTIDQMVLERYRLVKLYRGLLSGLVFQEVDSCAVSAYHNMSVLFPSLRVRRNVERVLKSSSIQTKRYFSPLHRMRFYRERSRICSMPVTDDIYDRILCLPMWNGLSTLAIDKVCNLIRKACV